MELKQIKIKQQIQAQKYKKAMDSEKDNQISLIKRDVLPYKYLMD